MNTVCFFLVFTVVFWFLMAHVMFVAYLFTAWRHGLKVNNKKALYVVCLLAWPKMLIDSMYP